MKEFISKNTECIIKWILCILTICIISCIIWLYCDGDMSNLYRPSSIYNDVSEYVDLEYIGKSSGIDIYYDKNTNVMYLSVKSKFGSRTMTPIINADGTPRLYDGE